MSYTPTTWVEGVTKVGPTNLNHLELGVQATAVVADAAVPKPGGAAANQGLVYNGTNWIAAALVNANIDPAAAIAYSKLNLAGAIVNNDIAGGAGIAQSKLANGPGFELNRVSFTSNVAVTATTAATAQTVVTSGAVTYDGTAVELIFFCPDVSVNPGPNRLNLELYEGATDIGVIGTLYSSTTNANACPRTSYIFTPTAGAHTYTVKAWVTGGTGNLTGGVGGAGTQVAGYVRIIKL